MGSHEAQIDISVWRIDLCRKQHTDWLRCARYWLGLLSFSLQLCFRLWSFQFAFEEISSSLVFADK